MHTGHGLIWLFSGSSKNFGPVIFIAKKYSIAQSNMILCPRLD